MYSPTKSHPVSKIVASVFILVLFSLIVGCVPTYYPEPLTNPACWSPTSETGGSGTFSQQPVEHWDWDGVSDAATRYGYTCIESTSPGEWDCAYIVQTYDRLCEVPAAPIPYTDLNDGSMNYTHAGRPVALYSADPVTIWGIDPWTGEGQEAFTVTPEQIEAAGVPADEPVLIAEGINPYTEAAILIYRLPTGEFQLNTWYVGGKPYVITWNEGSTEITTLEW